MNEIRIGQNIPGLAKGPVRVRQLVMFSAATGEFVDIHYDKDFALKAGLPDVIIQGTYKTAIICQMLKDWAGSTRTIKRVNVRHLGMDVVNNTLTAGGKVTKIEDNRVECEVWIDNQLGQRTVFGTASLVIC
ncbi:MAG: MaoC/PaaZ C-terminal domain-containing protein [Dehalococcoidales bacterium]|nr:MaoC/PaaZ C-terminal domain-containing protein [Dehalococcoidales bacterium]